MGASLTSKVTLLSSGFTSKWLGFGDYHALCLLEINTPFNCYLLLLLKRLITLSVWCLMGHLVTRKSNNFSSRKAVLTISHFGMRLQFHENSKSRNSRETCCFSFLNLRSQPSNHCFHSKWWTCCDSRMSVKFVWQARLTSSHFEW